jgi:hypothetical protein
LVLSKKPGKGLQSPVAPVWCIKNRKKERQLSNPSLFDDSVHRLEEKRCYPAGLSQRSA